MPQPDLTHDQIEARSKRRAQTKGPEYGALKSIFCAVGLGFGSGKRRTVYRAHRKHCELNGVKFFTPTGDFERTIALFNTEKPDGVIASPSDLLRYARAKSRTHKFKYILTSGSPLKSEVAKEVLEKLLAPSGVAYVSYGASEVGSISLGTFAQAVSVPGCVGRSCGGVQVKIVDGTIEVKTPTMAAEQASAWFKTGDKGSLTSDGLLVLSGRV